MSANNNINEIVKTLKNVEAKGELNIIGLKSKQKSYYEFAKLNLVLHIFAAIVMIILVSVCFCIFHVWEQIKENVSFFVAVFAMMSLFVFFFFVLIYLFVRLLKENRCLNSVIKKGNECDVFYAECIECKSINSLVFWRLFKVLDGSNNVFAVNSFQSSVAVLRVKEGDTVTVVLYNDEYVAIY